MNEDLPAGTYELAAAALHTAAEELAKLHHDEVAGLYLAEIDDILRRLRGEIDDPGGE